MEQFFNNIIIGFHFFPGRSFLGIYFGCHIAEEGGREEGAGGCRSVSSGHSGSPCLSSSCCAPSSAHTGDHGHGRRLNDPVPVEDGAGTSADGAKMKGAAGVGTGQSLRSRPHPRCRAMRSLCGECGVCLSPPWQSAIPADRLKHLAVCLFSASFFDVTGSGPAGATLCH